MLNQFSRTQLLLGPDGMERLFLHPELLEGMQRELEQHDFGNTHEISCYYELFESDVSGENE